MPFITLISCHNCFKQSKIINGGNVLFCPSCGEICKVNNVTSVEDSFDFNQIKSMKYK